MVQQIMEITDEEALEHPEEIAKKKVNLHLLPLFYYSIDDDVEYKPDEVKDIAKLAYNEAVADCMKKIQRYRCQRWDEPLVREMHRLLVDVIIT